MGARVYLYCVVDENEFWKTDRETTSLEEFYDPNGYHLCYVAKEERVQRYPGKQKAKSYGVKPPITLGFRKRMMLRANHPLELMYLVSCRLRLTDHNGVGCIRNCPQIRRSRTEAI